MGEVHRQRTCIGTDIPSGMPLRGREEHESALFVHLSSFRATFEGSSPYKVQKRPCDSVHNVVQPSVTKRRVLSRKNVKSKHLGRTPLTGGEKSG